MPASRSAIGTPTLVGCVDPGHRHQAALALRDLVVAGAVRLGTVVPEAGDRADHQPRVELVEPLDGEAEPVEDADPEVLQQHVGAAYQRRQHLGVGRVLEVEDDRLLVAVGRHEVRRVLVVARRPRRPTAGPRPGCRRRSALSTLITRAPRSPSIIAACGPARARVRSTTSTSDSGPCGRRLGHGRQPSAVRPRILSAADGWVEP